MAGFFKNLFKPNENSPRFRREFANRLNGRHIRYVTTRDDNGEEIVLGHDGCLALHDGLFTVLSDGIEQFVGNVDETSFSELMSLDGVILTGSDLSHGGELRTVVAYYKYYR